MNGNKGSQKKITDWDRWKGNGKKEVCEKEETRKDEKEKEIEDG